MNEQQATTIQVLDSALADQIAAGEVVERPASVVKELVENALDAGAHTLTVELDQGGLARVRVTDDGHGMSEADAHLCVRRHATSKLRRREDLFAIRTLGFRGEALPSIASVSRFTLKTRRHDADAGTQIQIEGGNPTERRVVGCAPGTSVEVRDLFYNVPARRKFLKSLATEASQVTDVCLRTALAHPRVQLTLIRDGRRAREWLPTDQWQERCCAAFPKEHLRAIEGQHDGVALRAMLSAPERSRTGAGGLHLFVNGRPIRDASLARTVAYAYGSVLPAGRYPIGAVFLELDPETIDVNVHPQKAEVRFTDTRGILDAVMRVLAGPLGHSRWSAPSLSAPTSLALHSERTMAPFDNVGEPVYAPQASSVRPYPVAPITAPEWGTSEVRDAEPHTVGTHTVGPEDASTLLPERGFFAALNVLGQAHRTFIICEGQQGLYIIDQHAADERIRFHRLLGSLRNGQLRTQRLLFPERIHLRESDVTLIDAHASHLAQLGLECRALGAETVAIHTVPALLFRASPERLVLDVLDELTRSGARAFGDALDKVVATMACHAAIRAGDILTTDECRALLASLDEVQDHAGHCPHGRPIVCQLDFADLARKLGR